MADNPMVVKAVNTSPKDFPVPHNGGVLWVAAHGERFVPWDAMASLWGDPGFKPSRGQTRFDYAMLCRGQFGWFHGLDDESTWDQRRPPIEWYTIEGDRLWTVLDDPHGTQGGRPTSAAPTDDQVFLLETIAELQQQIAGLQAAQAQRDATVADSREAETLTVDSGDLPQPDPTGPSATTDDPKGARIRGGR